MQDYNNEQWYLDLQKSLEGFTEDYLNKVSDSKLRQLEASKIGGKTQGKINAENGQLKKAGTISATKQWKQNRECELQKCKKGGIANAKLNGKPVIMCDMNGNELKYFDNRADAANYVNGHKPPLVQVIDKLTHSYKGYKWITPK